MISPSSDFVRWVVWTQVRRGGRGVEGAQPADWQSTMGIQYKGGE